MAHDEQRPNLARVTEDSFAALIRAFMQSPKWVNPPPLGYSEATKALWGSCLRLAAHPNALGAVPLQTIKPSLVQAFLDGLTGFPGKQQAAKAALSQLDKWACVRDHLPRSIMTGVETDRPTGGHVPWVDWQIALAAQHVGEDVRRAIVLARYTGQRCSDLVRICPTDREMYRDIDGIRVIQQKTGREVWVPLMAELKLEMAGWEKQPGPYLRHNGAAWQGPKALAHAWGYRRDTIPELAPLKEAKLVMHGLRATACVELKRAGLNDLQIGDIVGMSKEMVERYCRFSAQRDNAVAAVVHLETFRERNRLRADKTGS